MILFRMYGTEPGVGKPRASGDDPAGSGYEPAKPK